MKDIFKYHKKQIEKRNKKYPLMEYFIDQKPIEECSKECQEQVKSIRKNKREN
tara:strand:- start:376 stop:534 length:159 start_codon:yes stop_codon:yes gene_type:complete